MQYQLISLGFYGVDAQQKFDDLAAEGWELVAHSESKHIPGYQDCVFIKR